MALAAFVTSLLAVTMVVVPLDDRPVTAQLPRLLGAIAGVRIAEPPRPLLGRYLAPGQPDALGRWLREQSPRDAGAYVVSADMMVYGGLVASRVPGVTRGEAYTRLDDLAAFRASRPDASFSVFGTVMRLAPTGVPRAGAAASWPFAGEDLWGAIQQYANLPDPPRTDAERERAARLRERLGPQLDAYLATRARNRDVDLWQLRLAAEGRFDRVVLGGDDAGPQGLHLRDLAALRAYAARWTPPTRASIEPGADELAMALLAAALARSAQVAPVIDVVYSRPDGGSVNDPLEFAPIATTIADLVRTCGARIARPGEAPSFVLYVRVPNTPPADEQRFIDAIAAAPERAAIADLSFLATNDYAQQRDLTEALIARNVAGRVLAFASWNTVANTVGTTLPEAIAVQAGRARGSYDPRAHATFTFMRYVDDVAFHAQTRPAANADLDAAGVRDHTLLAPEIATRTASAVRADLWRRGLDLLARIAPQFRDAGFTITLPWDRTFETELDVRLTPQGSVKAGGAEKPIE